MERERDLFLGANERLFKALHSRWRKQQSRTQILRSQVGFVNRVSTRPDCCQGCVAYHGKAYGSTLETRCLFICAIHPQGWNQPGACPDWTSDWTQVA